MLGGFEECVGRALEGTGRGGGGDGAAPVVRRDLASDRRTGRWWRLCATHYPSMTCVARGILCAMDSALDTAAGFGDRRQRVSGIRRGNGWHEGGTLSYRFEQVMDDEGEEVCRATSRDIGMDGAGKR